MKLMSYCRLMVMLLLALAYCRAGASDSTESKKAADFKMPDLAGKKTTLKQLQKDSKLVMIMFSKADCAFSKEADKGLSEISTKFTGKGLKLAVIHIGAIDDAAKKFYEETKLSSLILLDADEKTADAYKVEMIPDVILINPKGEIVFEDLYNAELSDNIETVLNGGTAKPSKPGSGMG